jgi:hypothetical protein
VLTTELPDLRQLIQRINVEDRHFRTMGAENYVEPSGLDVAGDDLERRILVDDGAYASSDEIFEVGDDQGDSIRSGHGGWRMRNREIGRTDALPTSAPLTQRMSAGSANQPHG